MTEPESPGREPAWKSRRLWRILGGTVGVAIAAVAFLVVLPRIADYRDVWEVVKGLSWQWIVALLLVAALNVVTFAPPWMAAVPGLRFRPALAVTLASTASTYIAPGGAAVGMATSYAMFRAWGFPASAVALAVTLTGIWNQLVLFGFPAIALAALTLEGGSHPGLTTAALLGLVGFAVILAGFVAGMSSRRAAVLVGDAAARSVSWIKRVARRGPVSWSGEDLARFRARAIGLLRRRWLPLTLGTLAGHLSIYAVLVGALLAVGVGIDEVTIVESFAAWALVRLLGSLPLTPGGLGLVEVGLTGALVAFGAGQEEAVAATLLYRVLTVVPPLLIGLAAGATWRRHHPGLAGQDSAAL